MTKGGRGKRFKTARIKRRDRGRRDSRH